MLKQITRVFPKIKVSLGQQPTNQEILSQGFDIKLTEDIRQKLISLLEETADLTDKQCFITIYATENDDLSKGLNVKYRMRDINTTN